MAGAQIAAKMASEYQKWDGRNSQDPAAYDAWVADFLANNLTTDDPDVLKGVMPFITNAVNSGYTQNTQDRASGYYNDAQDANLGVASMALDEANTRGLASGTGTDYEALWGSLLENRQTALDSGMLSAPYDEKLVDVITRKALEHRDPAMLALLDRTLPGETTPISAQPYGLAKKSAAIDAMETINSQQQASEYTQQQRQEAIQKDTLTAFAIEKLATDPDHVFDEKFLNEFSKVEPRARILVNEWRGQVDGGSENPEAVLDLEYRIRMGGEDARSVITQGMESGIIRKPETLSRLYAAGNLGEEGGQQPAWQKSQQFTLASKTLQQAASQVNDTSNPFNPERVSPAAMAVTLDLQLAMQAWAKANPDQASNPSAYAAQITMVANALLSGVSLGSNPVASYVRPDAIDQVLDAAGMPDNPAAFTETQLEEQAAVQAEQAAQPAAIAPEWFSEAAPAIDTLPADEQQLIRERADALAIDPQEYANRMYTIMQQQDAAEAADAPIIDGLEEVFDEYEAQPLTTQPTDIPSSTGGTRVLVEDPVFQDTSFESFHEQIRGRANLMSGNAGKWGTNSNTAEWQQANLVSIKTPSGQGLQVHKEAASAFSGFLADLEATGYVIKKVGGYNYRTKNGGAEGLSEHAFGNAIDINWFEDGNGFSQELVTNLPANVSQMAAKWGLSWGGDWKGKKDAMHFEWTGVNPPAFQNAGPVRVQEPSEQGILEFIAQSEGTAEGQGYNETYGYGQFVEPGTQITDMTIGQITDLQDNMAMAGGNALQSTAVGKYQIVQDTLRDAMVKLSLPEDTKFTPEVQDQIALWLLERRGLSKWRSGEMPTETFVDNLSKEWASLAGSNGQPYYDGQGAGANLDHLLAALETIK
jgi:muramidase (phage lysozyme)